MLDKYLKQLGRQQLFRYLTTGGMAFAAEYLSFLLLFLVFSLPIIAANTISFLVGLGVSFTCNRKWTFKAQADAEFKWAIHHQLAAYLLLSFFNLLASNAIIYISHQFLPAPVSKVLAVGTIACWNFFIYRSTIFKTKNNDAG